MAQFEQKKETCPALATCKRQPSKDRRAYAPLTHQAGKARGGWAHSLKWTDWFRPHSLDPGTSSGKLPQCTGYKQGLGPQLAAAAAAAAARNLDLQQNLFKPTLDSYGEVQQSAFSLETIK
eukprot:552369-Pelagomonas_calceolata.AAC.3